MNWSHLKAIVWLRWRLGFNQIRKSGSMNTVLTFAFLACLIPCSLLLFIVTLAAGIILLPQAEAMHVLYLWIGLTTAFLFFWLLGVMMELQRSDLISFDKLLHLPISLSGAFLLNYVGSLASISLIVFAPSMFALCLATVITKGAASLVMLPLLAGFFWMVTATTFQLRGWLATLMQNKRRRRSIMAVIAMSFILLCQAPNLVNMFYWRNAQKGSSAHVEAYAEAARIYQERVKKNTQDMRDLTAALKAREIDLDAFKKKFGLLKEQLADVERENKKQNAAIKERKQAVRKQQFDSLHNAVLTASMAAPPGWLAYGSFAALENRPLPGLLGVLGSILIGGVSLRRAYRSTVRFYQGDYSSGRVARPVKKEKRKKEIAQRTSSRLLQRKIPVVSEETSAVAMATFRSLTRATEAQLALASPIIMFVVFGSMLFFGPLSKMPHIEMFSPLMAFCVVNVAIFGILMLLLNQFGTDRDGFRCYVLSPAPRRDILLGKNLSMAPFAFGVGGLGVFALHLVFPLHVSHLLASFAQLISVYCIACLLGNQTSILAPFVMPRGGMQKKSPKLTVILTQFAFMMVLPVALLPTLIPLGIHYLFDYLEWGEVLPVYLLLSLATLVAVLFVGPRILNYQARLLQRREQKILIAVTEAAE